MSKLEDLRDYLHREIGGKDDITVIYDRGVGPYPFNTHDRIRVQRLGCWICSIYDTKLSLFNVIFYDPFICRSAGFSSVVNLTGSEIPRAIKNRIRIYESTIINNDNNKEKEVKNMANRRFIVEKMEVEQRCCEPDAINMTIRKEPDDIIPETGKKLKVLIESLDPDKLSSDYRINVNVDNDTVQKQIYMMTARGSGKTRWVSDLLKNAWSCNDKIKDVIFNDPATIVFWVDGSKTVVKCQKGETFDPEKGLAMAISKKVLGNDYGYYETFAKHVGRYNKKHKEKGNENS